MEVIIFEDEMLTLLCFSSNCYAKGENISLLLTLDTPNQIPLEADEVIYYPSLCIIHHITTQSCCELQQPLCAPPRSIYQDPTKTPVSIPGEKVRFG